MIGGGLGLNINNIFSHEKTLLLIDISHELSFFSISESLTLLSEHDSILYLCFCFNRSGIK